MKDMKKALAVQGILMLLISLIGFFKKTKVLSQRESFLFGVLGLISLQASGFVNKEFKINFKKGT